MIEFQNVSKSFGAQKILESASFRINPGERVGIVGPNGAGKSTVFNLIVGDISPDQGTVTIARTCELGYMHQELRPDNTSVSVIDYAANPGASLQHIRETIESLDRHLEQTDNADPSLRRLGELQTRFEHMGGYDIRHRAESALSGLGFTEETLRAAFGTLSGGWKLRAELARLLVASPDVLLLDEPSNYLDIPAIEWLQRYLQDFKGTLALISHDRYLLNSLTRVTIEVANYRTERYPGNYAYYAKERQLRYDTRIATRKNQDKRKQQIERFVERFRAKNTKATQVQSKIKMLERMEEVEIPQQIVSPGRIRLPKPPRSGMEIARLDDVGLTYDNQRWVLRGVDFRIERGQKVALVGLNGLGKTTLLRMLAGQLKPSEGRRVIGHNVELGYQSQDFAETLDPMMSVYENVKSASATMSERDTRTLLGGFGFSGDAVQKRADILSGGEKIRVAFARLMMRPTNFLILDEPTTHLDITARETLENALHDYEGTLCLVSHDVDFVRNVATSIVAMTPPGITQFWGDYDYYRDKLAEQSGDQPRSAAGTPGKQDRKAEKKKRAERIQEFSRRARPLKKTISKAESDLDRLEKEQVLLLERLEAGPTGYAEINQRLTLIQQEIDRASREWETAAEALETLEAEKNTQGNG